MSQVRLYTGYFDNTGGSYDLVYEFDMALATEFFDKTWVEFSLMILYGPSLLQVPFRIIGTPILLTNGGQVIQ